MKIITAVIDEAIEKNNQKMQIIEAKVSGLSLKLNDIQIEQEISEIQGLINSVNNQSESIRSMVHSLAEIDVDYTDLEEALIKQMDAMQSPYPWAVTIYSAARLSTLEWVNREITKRILRDYFEPKGMKYDGWNPNFQVEE